ncbi:phenolpthiocerol synthesis polyketide synthase ppsa [Stemphylium lycopersici]|uniref:Phenolpthiocerol synthesis polyketide synthase ppsa n=1 Tax=Stemphylium lycopersici TaxID=183478 RepID=A0A364MT23_STELY|nr:phenolpthiocerol synthesis polyketide synthase ppsa [Stemphylium lycopersici]RAR02204.1 phenolpthiocerol synthesis polyketide synthase ppsa [Stemphylium lycopersici]
MACRDSKSMPIAIVGFGCRFPGDVTNGEKLWDMLVQKKSARGEVPQDRFNVDAFYNPDGDRYGTCNNHGGHYLTEDVSLFDAPFFSIAPAEAMAMDPMQRLLLEVTYEALENSGTPLSKASGSNTSCYVGCFTKDYEEMQRRDMELAPKYQSTGASQTMLSNRLSYFFNLKGPSVSIDTACSSGLVAVHLACQSLRTGESSMAIAGGSNLILSPDIQIEMSDMHFLSPDSISHAFDHRANGYARGEGVGAIILKPLDLALRDNDPIRAVIRGTAASSDGKTPGITMPSRDAQVDLIRSAYRSAGIDVSETGYFEAHGTGTAAGDPIESGAIGEVFAASRPRRNGAAAEDTIPLSIGSIKTNMGHLEGASGIAGIIKALLSVEKGIVAPNLWFERGNSAIDFEGWRVEVPTEPKEWPLSGPRRASINSFGYGGTNAHVILDDAYNFLQHYRRSMGRPRNDSGFVSPVSDRSFGGTSRARIFLQSANDERSLNRMGQDLAGHLQAQTVINEEELLDNLAYTVSERRSRFPYTSTIVAADKHDLESKLQNIRATSGHAAAPPRVGFIFTGQGAQWWGMGRELLHYPIFRKALQKCDAVVSSLGAEWSLMEELLKDKATSRVNEAAFSQPLCTALQVALVDQLAAWKILPQSVIGHSSGEIAAAYATGALSLQSAMSVAFFRGSLSPKVKGMGYEGRMMAVGLSEDDANLEIKKFGDAAGKVVVACVNSPRSVTISGDAAGIQGLQKALEAKGIFARLLQVDTAYHSHHMQAIAQEYLARLKEANVMVVEASSGVTMFSSVTEDIVENDRLGAEYWVSNLVGSVRFSGALERLCTSDAKESGHGVDVLLEVGPHALFKVPVKEILESAFGEKSQIKYFSTLVRNKSADVTALEAAGQLVSLGHPVDLRAVNFPNEPKQPLSVLTNLPQYPWNHTRRYWCESRLSRDYRFRRFARTDILGAPVSDWNPMEPRFRNFMRLREQPWLKDHMVQGDVLFPACGYLCMAIEACRQMSVISPSTFLPQGVDNVVEYRLREVSISRALVVPDTDEGVETSFSMRCQSHASSSAERWHEFCIYSYTPDGGWAENCRGLVSVSNQTTADTELAKECLGDWTAARSGDLRSVDTKSFYEGVDAVGLAYGPTFQGLQEISINPRVPNQAAGVIEVTNTRASNPKDFEHDRLLHPATLDTFLQLGLAALGGAELSQLKGAMVPTFIEDISVSADIAAQTGDRLNVLVNARRNGAREAVGDIVALDPSTSKPVVLMDGFKFVALNNGQDASSVPSQPKHCYKPVWEPDVELIDRQHLNRELQSAPRPDDRPKTVRELELLSYYFIDKALREVKESEASAMLPHHKKFYQNLCELRGDVLAKAHPQQTEEWQQLHSPEVASKLEAMVEHYRNHPTAYDGKLLVRVGEALPAVFRQEVEPLALMTHENLLEDYYTTAVGMPNTYAQISRFTSMLSHKHPNLDYLEIGAGTGGATVPTLQGLSGFKDLHTYPRLKSYTYTDISSYFFQRAAEKFDHFSQFMNFKKLDVENDPEMQSFKPASYDVIVAANVLHATSDMYRTMTHVRKLLRPGGRLILLEMTNRLLAASVIFGTLPGWWNASEAWRTGGPLLTESQWEDVLNATGFSSLQASSPDVLDPLEEGTRLMIATAVESKPNVSHGLLTPPESHRFVIVCPDSRLRMSRLDMPLALKTRLEKAGLQAQLVPLSKLDPQLLVRSVCVSFVELDEPLLAKPSPSELKALQSIADSSEGLIWVTRGAASSNVERPELAVFQGLARTLRAENEGFACITVDLDAKETLPAHQVAEMLYGICEKQLSTAQSSGPPDSEFIEQGGVLCIKRAMVDDKSNQFLVSRTDPTALRPQLEPVLKEDRQLKLNAVNVSGTRPFVFEEDSSASLPLHANEVEIEVQATSLSLRDAETLNGERTDSKLGQECAGIVTHVGTSVKNLAAGDRVSAWCPGTFATRARIPAAFAHKLPDHVAFDTAATLPLAYSTAHYALIFVAHLENGDRVLIHEAAGAVGRAAIQIASSTGARIFATVKSAEERALLVGSYGIADDCIFSSDDLKFVAALRRATKGRGVDVVLNTVTGEALQATFSCVAPFGRFVDLNVRSADRLEMAPFERNVSFTSVDMTLLYRQKPKLASRVFQEGMSFAVAGESLQHPGVKPMPWSKLDDAVKMLQDANHNDQVVLVPQANDYVLVAQKPAPPISFDPHASYLLAGGLGGLGRSIAQWLITNGARHLIFVSRSGAVSASAQAFVSSLQNTGIQLAILKCDVSDPIELSNAISTTLQSFPAIKGVIQGAMTLNDALFANMTQEQWTRTIEPKVHGSKNLHDVTITQPLDFFVLLSSLHSFIGNPGQANYAAGCAYQVALAQYRTKLGLPATAIDLGIVGDVGYVVEKRKVGGQKIKVHEFKHIGEADMLALIELGIRDPMTGHLVTGLDSNVHLTAASGGERPFFANDPVLSHLDYLRPHLDTTSTTTPSSSSSTSTSTDAATSLPLSAHLSAPSSSPDTKKSILLAGLLKKLARSLMMEPADLDPARALTAYGCDSLVAVELKNWVMRETKVGVSVFDVLQGASIEGLVDKILDRFGGAGRHVKEGE